MSSCPLIFALHILKASAREAAHTSHESFRSCVLCLTWPFRSSSKIGLSCAHSRAQRPEQACSPLQHHGARCTWSPTPPARLHHTTFGTAHSNPNQPVEGPLVSIDAQSALFWALAFAPGKISLSNAGPPLLSPRQLDQDQGLVVVDFNELKAATIFLLLPSVMPPPSPAGSPRASRR